MKRIKYIILWAAVMPYHFVTYCQQESDSNFRWQHAPGIYTSFIQFRENAPGMPGNFVVLSASEIKEYLNEGLLSGSLPATGQFIWLGRFGDDGEFLRVHPDSVWAYATNREVFIRHDDHLVRLDPVGAISYFNTSNTLTGKIDNGKRFVFKYDDGKIRRFNRSSFLNMISDDLELYQQFLRLDSYRTMKNAMPEFLMMYNQRHPVFPPGE
ncbi:MAG: hypothetical protein P8100_01250 [bacterium]